MNISEYILESLQKKYSFKKDMDLESFNYIENGYMDSLGLIQFIVDLEDTFDIEFSPDEVNSENFQIVGRLISLVQEKQEKKNSNI